MNPFSNFPRFLRNYYAVFGLSFLIWMLFIDSNDFISQYQLTRKLNTLIAQKEYYLEKKVDIEAKWQELTTNEELLEKFARENYLMKRPSEDVYIVIREE